MPTILPVDKSGDFRTARIDGLSAAQITKLLGFKPNVQDDLEKVANSWGFTVDGDRCGVWDYRGSHEQKEFSAWGPLDSLQKVFGDKVGVSS